MKLAVFTVEKQEVDSHLQVGNFVCDFIHDILEPFQIYLYNTFSVLCHCRNIFLNH